jgi:hypothetical protein
MTWEAHPGHLSEISIGGSVIYMLRILVTKSTSPHMYFPPLAGMVASLPLKI